MDLLPLHTEILVSSLKCGEVVRRLDAVTRDVNFLDVEDYHSEKKFNGKVNSDHFHLSLEVDSGDSFLPLIKGKIEPTKAGCIIFLEYKLFPGSIFFLYFWMIVTTLMGLFFLFVEQEWLFSMLSFGVGIGNLAFAWSHFNRKVIKSQKIFHEMLSLQRKD